MKRENDSPPAISDSRTICSLPEHLLREAGRCRSVYSRSKTNTLGRSSLSKVQRWALMEFRPLLRTTSVHLGCSCKRTELGLQAIVWMSVTGLRSGCDVKLEGKAKNMFCTVSLKRALSHACSLPIILSSWIETVLCSPSGHLHSLLLLLFFCGGRYTLCHLVSTVYLVSFALDRDNREDHCARGLWHPETLRGNHWGHAVRCICSTDDYNSLPSPKSHGPVWIKENQETTTSHFSCQERGPGEEGKERA